MPGMGEFKDTMPYEGSPFEKMDREAKEAAERIAALEAALETARGALKGALIIEALWGPNYETDPEEGKALAIMKRKFESALSAITAALEEPKP